DSYKIYSPTADIYFDEVENLITPLLDKYKIENRYGNVTVQKVFAGLGEDIDFSKFDLEINNEESFNIVADEVIKVINKGVLPFFNTFNTLHAVNEEICRLDEDAISNFISGIIGIKIPLIKKLIGAKDLLEELKIRKQFYSYEAIKYPQYFKDHDKVFNDLFSEDLRII
ncbi:MAG TPA: hypothetical protein P5556_10745, partial [Candidatus Gastranaerophilales bacterium]|nr:hypothetical protein [Candidatus Gastranaerophilales bacterium]